LEGWDLTRFANDAGIAYSSMAQYRHVLQWIKDLSHVRKIPTYSLALEARMSGKWGVGCGVRGVPCDARVAEGREQLDDPRPSRRQPSPRPPRPDPAFLTPPHARRRQNGPLRPRSAAVTVKLAGLDLLVDIRMDAANQLLLRRHALSQVMGTANDLTEQQVRELGRADDEAFEKAIERASPGPSRVRCPQPVTLLRMTNRCCRRGTARAARRRSRRRRISSR
jgi:hypothetical protein